MTVGILNGSVTGMFPRTFIFDPSSVAANTTAEQTVTINGLRVGDYVVVAKPTLTAGLGISHARVSAANTLAITLINSTASPIDAPSETWMYLLFRPELPLVAAAQ